MTPSQLHTPLKLALLKGNRLNPWHLALYEKAIALSGPDSPLEITAFAPSDNLFDSSNLSIPVVTIPYEYEAGSLWSRVMARWRYRWMHERTGYEFHFHGLEEQLTGFDIIQSWETFNPHSLAAVKAAKARQARTLITVWDDIPHNYEQQSSKAFIKNQVRPEADAFLVYTGPARLALEKEGVSSERIHRIWPAIDLQRFRKEHKPPEEFPEKWSTEESLTLLFAGRLVTSKGVYDLLEATMALIKEGYSVQLALVGGGPEEDKIKSAINHAGLQDRIRLFPRQSYTRMPQWLQAVDVIVLPSLPGAHWREQFGMIALEGLAAGKPVIASRSPGMEEMLGESALLVDPGNKPQLQKHISHLYADCELRIRLSQSGRKRAEEKFDLDKNATALLEIYRKVLST
jgi:glycosyltransferase involved in cell wall biosynthesis